MKVYQQHQIIMSLTSLGEQDIPTIKTITQSYFEFLINNPIPDDFIKLMQMAKQQAFYLEEAHDLEKKVTDLSQHLRQGRSIDQWLSSQYSQDGIESLINNLKTPSNQLTYHSSILHPIRIMLIDQLRQELLLKYYQFLTIPKPFCQ